MRAGDVVGDRFEIAALAGKGGMGEVWRARDRVTGHDAAVKLLAADGSEHGDRLLGEARVLANLDHPSIVRYVAHGESPTLFLAMEWLEGEDLAARLARGPLELAESSALIASVARALSRAHAHGVVHRDIKPSNLFLVDKQSARVKVLDFGIARAAQTRFATATGLTVGTLGYMAPEQASANRAVDARADVYSLGCVFFECLTGQPAFDGEHVMAVLAKILCADVPRVSEVRTGIPAVLDDLVARMLAKLPSDRPSADAVAQQLEALGPIDAGPSVSPSRAPLSLTGHERRLVAFVLAEAERVQAVENAPTLAEIALPGAPSVGHLGGRIERLADGSVLVVFRASEAATDLAANAARCALAMRVALPSSRIAVAMGRSQAERGIPIGQVLDRAAHLLRMDPKTLSSPPIRIDEITAGLLDARFDVGGDASSLELRGERETSQSRLLLGRPTACVGRDGELAMLSSAARECFVEPRATALLVTAPPGFGKTRVRHELVRAVQASEPHMQMLYAHGDAMSAGSPFGLLAQLLRAAAGLSVGESPEVRQNKLHARVARHVPEGDVLRVTEFLGELASVSSLNAASPQLRAAREDARLMGDQMQSAWEDFLAAECAAEPLMIVLDNLHWGDLPTVRLIDAALRSLHDKPLLVLALARPEVHELFPNLWAGRRMQVIRLPELTRSAAERLVVDVLGTTTPPSTVSRLVERAAGNAFYLEELIRAVAEGRSDALPETVLAMAQSRLEQLDAESRKIMRAASVFGEVFGKSGLDALVRGVTDLDAKLAKLVDLEVIGRRASSRFRDEAEFVFRHGLVRDAAYAMLTDADRTTGHRLAAAWLEAHGEPDAMTLAEHFERGAEPTRAIAWYRRAAVQALEGNDLVSVIARARRGIACGAHGDDLGFLQLLIAESHGWRGENSDQAVMARSALESLTRDTPDWFRAGTELALVSCRTGDREQLRVAGEALRAFRPVAPVGAAYLRPMSRVIIQFLISNEIALADAALARLDEIEAQVAQDDIAQAALKIPRAMRAVFDGNPELYMRDGEAIIRAFETNGDGRYASTISIQVMVACLVAGQYEQGVRWGRHAVDVAAHMGLPTTAARAKATLALHLAYLRQTQEATEVVLEARAEGRAQRDRVTEGQARLALAIILRMKGDLAEAEREAREIVEESSYPPMFRSEAYGLIARLLASRDAAEALQFAREGMRLGALGSPTGFGAIRVGLIEALQASGMTEAAHDAIQTAARDLQERVAMVQNAELRRSILENIPDHARILELAKETGQAT